MSASVGSHTLTKSKKHQSIARDWSPGRKRFVAAVACISTALVGVLLGIYAGLVPSIQYYIPDDDHYSPLGNVGCFAGLALPTFLFWPLPLLHGRKPYILCGLIIAMALLFPQAIAVSAQRMTYIREWRMLLLVTGGFMGLFLGFASMNFHSILTDLFGASLMGANPHQEVVDNWDVRRHGGGMGVWLGIWTWCWIGSLGVGFLIGATIINYQPPAWGFYLSIIMVGVVLVLNVLCPEVRRSPFRRSVAEVRTGLDISRRVARGEIMMHRVKTGPRWWGQEVYHGILLSLEMLRQPGFAILALYSGWIYAQVMMIIVLLGALTSRFYRLQSPFVGLMVGCVALGAVIAIPFQKASIFSRARHHQQNVNKTTLDAKLTWTSHLIRRSIFTIFLPLCGIGYTLVSTGPPMTLALPALFAGAIGFLSCLAISEVNGLIMETFDDSDLQPGMTGRPRRRSSANAHKRTNYSSFPRVSAGLACCHTFGYLLAGGATAWGGMAQRNLGQRQATGVVAGILLFLTALLLIVLIRFHEVEIIPRSKTLEMEEWAKSRRSSLKRHARRLRADTPASTRGDDMPERIEDDEMYRPVMIGHPVAKTRRMNILELGGLTRWTEIRKKNKLIDEMAAAHPNRAIAHELGRHLSRSSGGSRLSLRSRSRRGHHPGRDDDQTYGSSAGEGLRDLPIELNSFKVTPRSSGRVTTDRLKPGRVTPRRGSPAHDGGELSAERSIAVEQTLQEVDESGQRGKEAVATSIASQPRSYTTISKVGTKIEPGLAGDGRADGSRA